MDLEIAANFEDDKARKLCEMEVVTKSPLFSTVHPT
jgi:hypothetical protein